MKLQEKFEKLKEMVCDGCHYPHIYKSEEVMRGSQCAYCERMKLITELEEDALDKEEHVLENLVACDECSYEEPWKERCALKGIDVGADQACVKGWRNEDDYCECCQINLDELQTEIRQ